MKYLLQHDYSTDDIAEWQDVAEGPTLAGLLHVAEHDFDVPRTYLRIVDTEAGEIVAERTVPQEPWKVDYFGLSGYTPPIDYTGFAHRLLKEQT